MHHALTHTLTRGRRTHTARHHPLTHRLLVSAALHHAGPHPVLHALCGRLVNRGDSDADSYGKRQKNAASPHVFPPLDAVRLRFLGRTPVIASLDQQGIQ
jgi:hypothetical protein